MCDGKHGQGEAAARVGLADLIERQQRPLPVQQSGHDGRHQARVRSSQVFLDDRIAQEKPAAERQHLQPGGAVILKHRERAGRARDGSWFSRAGSASRTRGASGSALCPSNTDSEGRGISDLCGFSKPHHMTRVGSGRTGECQIYRLPNYWCSCFGRSRGGSATTRKKLTGPRGLAADQPADRRKASCTPCSGPCGLVAAMLISLPRCFANEAVPVQRHVRGPVDASQLGLTLRTALRRRSGPLDCRMARPSASPREIT